MKHMQVPFFSFHMLAEGEGDVDEPCVTMHGNVFQPFDVFQIPSHQVDTKQFIRLRLSQLPTPINVAIQVQRVCTYTKHKMFLFTWSQHSHCESIKGQTLTHIDPTMTHLGPAYQRIPPLPYGCTVEELRFFGGDQHQNIQYHNEILYLQYIHR